MQVREWHVRWPPSAAGLHPDCEAIPLVKGETSVGVLGTGVSRALWWVRPRSLGGEKGARGAGRAVLDEGRVCPRGTEGTLAGMLVQATGLQAVCPEILYVDCASCFVFECLL